METRVVRVRDISKDDEEAWRRLGQRALEPNPFAEPDFLLLSTRHFEGYGDARLLIAQDGTELLGVLPITGFERPRVPPRRVATTLGHPTAVSGLQTPLVDPNDPDRTIDALVGGLTRAAKDEGWPGIVLFDEIGSDGPVARSLLAACEARGCPVFVKDSWERGMVSRAGQWSHPVDGKRGREIGRRHRQLAKESGAEATVVDLSREPTACEEFLEMEMAGWKGQEGGQAFARYPNMAAWFRQWHARWADSGRLTLLSLNVGSVPVAMHYFIRAGVGLFCFRIAFDEKYAKYSPGSVLLASSLTYLRENTDAEWIDSATNKANSFFLGMFPERRSFSRLLIGTGGRIDRAAVSALPAMTKIAVMQRQARTRLRGANKS